MSEAPDVFQLPEYECHKRVRAAKIVQDIELVDKADHDLVLELPNAITRLHWEVGYPWYLKHKPEVGGYIVIYADGYVSYSPAKAFEEGYSKLCG